jgi:hypothetical protein
MRRQEDSVGWASRRIHKEGSRCDLLWIATRRSLVRCLGWDRCRVRHVQDCIITKNNVAALAMKAVFLILMNTASLNSVMVQVTERTKHGSIMLNAKEKYPYKLGLVNSFTLSKPLLFTYLNCHHDNITCCSC